MSKAALTIKHLTPTVISTLDCSYHFPVDSVYQEGRPESAPKRKQVKNACTNCQKACKKCDDNRPCQRCERYNLADSCRDSARKERKKATEGGHSKAVARASVASSKKKRKECEDYLEDDEDESAVYDEDDSLFPPQSSHQVSGCGRTPPPLPPRRRTRQMISSEGGGESEAAGEGVHQADLQAIFSNLNLLLPDLEQSKARQDSFFKALVCLCSTLKAELSSQQSLTAPTPCCSPVREEAEVVLAQPIPRAPFTPIELCDSEAPSEKHFTTFAQLSEA